MNLVPELEVVIGKQPRVADLPPQAAQKRFRIVFEQFLGIFARREHPLTLFLDDLQWLDTATLDLLEYLFTHAEVRNLLLVGAFRDNEVGPAHPLLRTLDAIRKADAIVHEIVLAPLGLDDAGWLIADALHCERERAHSLAQLVHEKPGGNPFFAIQFLTALAEEGLLAFDPVALAWQWNIHRIRARSFTDNVVDLMGAKLKRFSTTTQEALKQVASLGNLAEIATLSLVHGETEEAMDVALLEAVHAGLVFHHDNAYKFLHDRIQQAAYSLIPKEHRAEVHLRIGRVLLARMTADQLAEHLFDVANQFNRGAAGLINRDEKAQVATIIERCINNRKQYSVVLGWVDEAGGKCGGAGAGSAAGGAAVAERPCAVGGGADGGRGGERGLAVAGDLAAERSAGAGSQAGAGAAAQIDAAPTPAAAQAPCRGPAALRLPQRSLDHQADRRGHRTRVQGRLPPGAGEPHPGATGLELSEARTPGAGAQCGG